ncbi:hypothetical protein [Parvularcula marina]|uniref:Uncharacterized protein n=1 Tax=Parvularcula marina TaxID=2292771 RepID=A0A371RH69_9PROT|nr:hypothetical protein [Parvularcula marina]RFB04786.1 hypothetical protein DX908_05520 [Parvularcula marina]
MASPVRQNEFIPVGDLPEAEAQSAREARVHPISAASVPLSIDDRVPLVSPARRMQQTLGREFAQAELDGEPWSKRRMIAFVAMTCGAFWLCVYFAVAALIG